MRKKITQLIKATIIDLIVALLITAILYLALEFFLGQKISIVLGMINTISVDTSKKIEKRAEYDEKSSKLKTYPEYGTQYATIEIPRIDVNLPVYYGDTLEVLKNGVGHSSGSYFPGEGGSIIYMGHNSAKVFRRFSELQLRDKITVHANYGDYTYQIYDMQIVKETDTEKLPIKTDEEVLMVYTCYPFNNIGYATQRYVVYAKLVK